MKIKKGDLKYKAFEIEDMISNALYFFVTYDSVIYL